jgi:hypothetical protein
MLPVFNNFIHRNDGGTSSTQTRNPDKVAGRAFYLTVADAN